MSRRQFVQQSRPESHPGDPWSAVTYLNILDCLGDKDPPPRMDAISLRGHTYCSSSTTGKTMELRLTTRRRLNSVSLTEILSRFKYITVCSRLSYLCNFLQEVGIVFSYLLLLKVFLYLTMCLI